MQGSQLSLTIPPEPAVLLTAATPFRQMDDQINFE